jgi:hypothetical protein
MTVTVGLYEALVDVGGEETGAEVELVAAELDKLEELLELEPKRPPPEKSPYSHKGVGSVSKTEHQRKSTYTEEACSITRASRGAARARARTRVGSSGT